MQTAQEMRERLFTMRMSAEESERYEKIAAHHNTSLAKVIRMLMDREEERIAREEAERQRAVARRWESDKALLQWLVELANRQKLKPIFDERRMSMGLLVDGRDYHLNLSLEGAIAVLTSIKGTALLEVDRNTGIATVQRGSRTVKLEPPLEMKY